MNQPSPTVTVTPRATICYLARDLQGFLEVCFAWKEKTPSAERRKLHWKWTTYGGKVETSDPTIDFAARRELYEESEVMAQPNQMQKMAIITYRREGVEDCECHIYIVRIPNAQPMPSREMTRPGWWKPTELPAPMIDGDPWVIETIFSGKKIEGVMVRDQNMKVILSETDLRIVDELSIP
ncbi:MAG TPA: NUDIX domain-containing protein [Candidatus Paceibacterota bacterium]